MNTNQCKTGSIYPWPLEKIPAYRPITAGSGMPCLQGAVGINASPRAPRNNPLQPSSNPIVNWHGATAITAAPLHCRLITSSQKLLQCIGRLKKIPRINISAWQNTHLPHLLFHDKTFAGSMLAEGALANIRKPGSRSLTTIGQNEEQSLITTTELYSIGPLPNPGPDQRRYLSAPKHWVPERRTLHDKLIANVIPQALKFAEAVRESGEEPTIYALRGNTAAGKTRMAMTAIPVLANALNRSNGGSVNPDIFKPHLRLKESGKFTSTQVHAESCALSDRFEDKLRPLKTADNAPVSILVDRRLKCANAVAYYAAMARETERKVVLCDIDAPLEKSFVGVLERCPDDDHPIPPYHAVSNGFSAIRTNRAAVIDQFIADPGLGSYQLYGTSPDGKKIKVANVEHGELMIDSPDLYAELTMAPGDLPARISERIIDEPLIESLTKDLDWKRADCARSALAKYIGMTWRQAIDAHSTKSE